MKGKNSSVVAINLKNEVSDRIRKEAKSENRSFSNYVETVLINHIKKLKS